MRLRKRCVRGPALRPGESLPTCCVTLRSPSLCVISPGMSFMVRLKDSSRSSVGLEENLKVQVLGVTDGTTI